MNCLAFQLDTYWRVSIGNLSSLAMHPHVLLVTVGLLSFAHVSAAADTSVRLDIPTGTVLYLTSQPTGSGCLTSNTSCSCSIEYTVLKFSSTKYQFTSNFNPSSEPSCSAGYQCYVVEIEGTLNDDGNVLTGSAKIASQDVGVASFAVSGTDTYTTFLGSCTYTYSTMKANPPPPPSITTSASDDDESFGTRLSVFVLFIVSMARFL